MLRVRSFAKRHESAQRLKYVRYYTKPGDTNPEVLREFVERARQELQLHKPEDWYTVSVKDICRLPKGQSLLKKYKSIAVLALNCFPDHKWEVWRFNKLPSGYWDSLQNRQEYMKALANHNNWSQLSDFYNIKKQHFSDYYGGGLLSKYNNSPPEVVKATFPEHEWLPWKFATTPMRWWKSVENQLWYMDWLKSQIGFKTLDDCYKLTRELVEQYHGHSLLEFYQYSIATMLAALYPNHIWYRWKFSKVPRRWWNVRAHREQFMEYLQQKLHIGTNLEQLYSLTIETIAKEDGLGILTYYKQKIMPMLQDLFPSHEWLPWKFRQAPDNWWKNEALRVKYLEWIRKELNLSLEDCYDLSFSDLIPRGGCRLVTLYKDVYDLVSDVYPHHEWQPWKFRHLSYDWWQDLDNQRKYMDWLRSVLHLNSHDDLYELTEDDLRHNYGSQLLALYNNNIENLVCTIYNDEIWDSSKFVHSSSLSWQKQKKMIRILNNLLKLDSM